MTKTLREGAPGRTPVVPRTAATHESQSRHTAVPWRAVDDGYGDGDGGCWRIDPAMKDDGMASGYRWFSREDAAFIVRACNHHEALLNALKDLVEATAAEVNEKGGGGYVLARLTDARDAIVNAEAT